MTTPRKSSSVRHPAQRGEPLVALDEGLVLTARDAPGGEGVDPHVGREHGREVAGQLGEAALARRVGRRVAHPGALVEAHVGADQAVDARHVDDAAVAPGAQQRRQPPGQREGRREVERQRRREGLVGLLLERHGIPGHAGGAGEGGVVDEHVAGAEPLARVVDHAREPLGSRRSAATADMPVTGERAGGRRAGGLVEVDDDDRAPAAASASASTRPTVRRLR